MSSSEGTTIPPKAPWNIEKIKGEQGVIIPKSKVLSEDWPSLEETVKKVGTLTLETKSCNGQTNRSALQSPTDSIDSGNGGELNHIEKSNEKNSMKHCDSKWPLISPTEDGQSTSGASSSNSSSHDESFPQLETRRPVRNKSRCSENGNSISSDEITESDTVPQNASSKKKKSSKPNWIPLTLPDLPPLKRTNFRHRMEIREKVSKPIPNGNISNSNKPAPPPTPTKEPIVKSQQQQQQPALTENANSHNQSTAHIPPRGQIPGPKPQNIKVGPRGRRNEQNPNKYYDHREPIYQYLRTPSLTPSTEFVDYSTDFATFTPVYPIASEFVMPYIGNDYFTASPVSNSTLISMLRNQIEYYFSEQNLSKDFFLRRKMDHEGYLPIHLIASFKRVQNLTQDLDLVMEAVRSSKKLEVKQSSVRTLTEPLKWPIVESGLPISPVMSSIPVPCVL